jgi:hypothetical protein
LAAGSSVLGHLETRLAGVVVAALKEAFDRDSRRLELERSHLDAERLRAERALRLELLRQAGEREIGRLRLIAGAAMASWIGTLFFSVRLLDSGAGSRLLIGMGWALLLSALATAVLAQGNVAKMMNRPDDAALRPEDVGAGPAGVTSVWLVVSGLAVIGLAVLVD